MTYTSIKLIKYYKSPVACSTQVGGTFDWPALAELGAAICCFQLLSSVGKSAARLLVRLISHWNEYICGQVRFVSNTCCRY